MKCRTLEGKTYEENSNIYFGDDCRSIDRIFISTTNHKGYLQMRNATTPANRFDAVVGLPTINVNEITLGDSLELCERIPAKTVDLILEDMPYNTTACEWDVKIDLELYWKTRLRILKPTGAIVLTASQPFTSELVMSNYKMFKHEWIWEKNVGSNFLNVVREPMKQHESMLIFGAGGWTYNPIKIPRIDKERVKYGYKGNGQREGYGKFAEGERFIEDKEQRNPKSVIGFQVERGIHPTQKPVGLFEYLIRTYSNEGDLVFDGFGGSGTTAVACHKSKRNFIVIEKEQKYFDLATRRLDNERRQLSLL